ncbi:MAG: hypothetical protein M0D55_11135 [Elusimicrobiota bacterium]|nr:MAG: hypothetical protein M0D55_11135 [Elusimicrobiota bacterium]
MEPRSPRGQRTRQSPAHGGRRRPEKYGPKAAPVLPELIKRLDSDDKRYDALIVIEKMGPAAAPAVPRLGELLKDKGWHDGAYSALRAIGTVEAQRLADDSPPWVVAPR